jgi:glucose uptake protein
LFKLAGPKWRFELFSIDFALGVTLLAVVAAYTLGSRGSELDFSDSMLVAGRRAQAMAIGAGAVFAFGNMLYLGTIALMGLSNGTLLTFSVFGCGVGLLQLSSKHFVSPAASFLIFASAGAFTFLSAKLTREAATARGAAATPGTNVRGPADSKAMTLSTKGSITAILAGLSFASVWPVLALAQTDDLAIGAYGGVLMAAIGILVATLFLNFFFMNISLEGGQVGYRNYLTGTWKQHSIGAASGVGWAAAALALYTAKTGSATVSVFDAWLVPFAAATVAAISGVVFWQKVRVPAAAGRNKWIALILFTAGAAVLLAGLYKP